MRRKEKEIADVGEMEEIVAGAKVCRLGLCDDGIPYVVPLCFGYREGAFYFHSAREGRKVDIIRANPQVCFEIDTDTILEAGGQACSWTMHFRSVMGTGLARIIEGREEKIRALEIIMEHYAKKKEFDFADRAVEAASVIRVDVVEMTGKKG